MVQFGIRFIVRGTVTGLRAARTWVWFLEMAQLFPNLQRLRLGGDIPLLPLHAFVARTWQVYLIIGSVYFLVNVTKKKEFYTDFCLEFVL
jgi:hypothetical protein